jgi:hypothetical protein
MLFKMDNTIVYTFIVPLIVGIFFGEIKYCHTLYVSNTKLIMRQSDQIQFLLTRIIELDKKIKKLNLDITQEEEELDCLQEEKEDVIIEEKELDCLQEEKLPCLEKDFELVEPSSTYKISKNNGWLRFIF